MDETGKPVLDENGKTRTASGLRKVVPHLTQAVGMVQVLANIMSENPNLPQSDAVASRLGPKERISHLKAAWSRCSDC